MNSGATVHIGDSAIAHRNECQDIALSVAGRRVHGGQLNRMESIAAWAEAPQRVNSQVTITRTTSVTSTHVTRDRGNPVIWDLRRRLATMRAAERREEEPGLRRRQATMRAAKRREEEPGHHRRQATMRAAKRREEEPGHRTLGGRGASAGCRGRAARPALPR
jgi:hypothetical protein